MELKQIIEQILPHYEKALIDMPQEDHYKWLRERRMEIGICYFAVKILLENIYDEISEVLYDAPYIGNSKCCQFSSYEYNLNQIQIRVDWMKGYLSKY